MFLKIINKLIYTAIHIVNYKNIISYFIVIYDYFIHKYRVVKIFSPPAKNFHAQRRRTKSRHFIISARSFWSVQKKIVRTSVILSHGVSVQRCTRPVRRRLQEMPSPEEDPSAGSGRRKAFSEQRQAKERISSPTPMPCLPATIVPPSLRGNFCGRWSHRRQRRTLLFSREDIRRTQKLRFLPLIDVSGSRAAARLPRLLFPLPEKNAKKQRDAKTDASCHAACCIDGILPELRPCLEKA